MHVHWFGIIDRPKIVQFAKQHLGHGKDIYSILYIAAIIAIRDSYDRLKKLVVVDF